MTAPLHGLGVAAVEYAARGWEVFPAEVRGKRPLAAAVPHGLRDATTDVKRVEAWWRRWPSANIAARAGHSFVVVDCDGEMGCDALMRLESSHSPLPETLTAESGGGGVHLFFAAPIGVRVKNSAGRIAPRVDVRGAGGYIVLPPSVHPTGRSYAWRDATVRLAVMPRWLVGLAMPAPPPSRPAVPRFTLANGSGLVADRVLGEECAAIAATPRGARNDRLFRGAAALANLVAGGELALDPTLANLVASAMECGLPRREAERTIESAFLTGLATPRALGGGRHE